MVKARLLQKDELENAGAFWVELRTEWLKTYLQSVHVIKSIDGDYVHMTCSVGDVVGQLTNYNVGWRAWLMKPTKEQMKSEKWDPVNNNSGIGYNWDYSNHVLEAEKYVKKEE